MNRREIISQFFVDAVKFDADDIEVRSADETTLNKALVAGFTMEPYFSYGIIPITRLPNGVLTLLVDVDKFMARTSNLSDEELVQELVYWKTRIVLRLDAQEDDSWVETEVERRLARIGFDPRS